MSGIAWAATGSFSSSTATSAVNAVNSGPGRAVNAGSNTGITGQFVRNATTGTSQAVYAVQKSTSNNAAAILGRSTAATGGTIGVFGRSDSVAGMGVLGQHSATTGTAPGVKGTTSSTASQAFGVVGEVLGTGPGGSSAGVRGISNGTGGLGIGVWGSQNGNGWGVNGFTPSGIGVRGTSTTGIGVYGSSQTQGVYGTSAAVGGYGGTFVNTLGAGNPNAAGIGLRAFTGSGSQSDLPSGFYSPAGFFVGPNGLIASAGTEVNGDGLLGFAGPAGVGVYAEANGGGTALTANGNSNVIGDLNVTGTLSKGGGSFKIDDPIDPANKYLYHSFVESPDMMNIYNGNVKLGPAGSAWLELPAWFTALNRDYRYQLTAMGAPAPNLYVAHGVTANRFEIAGGPAGVEVSWQVTGIRQDPWANANRIPNEIAKPVGERGLYLYPQLYGQPLSRGLGYQQTARQRALGGK
jgi:hypothetical protein